MTTHTPKEVKDFYDDIYSTTGLRDNRKYYRWIIKLLKTEPNQKILDVACGEGLLLEAGVEQGLIVSGLDISSKAVEVAQKNVSVAQLKVGEGENLPWDDNTFDYVTCLGSLEHYLDPDRGLNEMKRVLKPDGKVIVVLPNKFPIDEILDVMKTGRCDYEWQIVERTATKLQWKDFIEKNNFTVEKTLPFNKYPEFFKEGTHKVKSIRKFIKQVLIRCFCPENLAFHFVYILKPKNS
jgi:ubiquinone/menaquinone biosynthesis C-methylase UbiE